ncbi:amidohydrolase family protein [Roseomonas sp. OT10]|uniref:amidohydrolase family protein n=1 Tax=Roseomonas cutis TaxID=2897332 RepID=UPI001E547DB6|nr:amidohydrolase family protein [Roseomonas sp. OT10]UFN50590.1 amidohydrolase family protein [Roseomonas sp. OT10]
MRVDAHQHYWSLARGDYGWLTADLANIHRDFGPQDLVPHLARHGLDGTVLVQAAPTEAETRWLLDLARDEPTVLGVVGWTELEGPMAAGRVAALAAEPKLVGLRPMAHDLPDPDWLARPSLDPALREMAAAGLVFDALVRPAQMPAMLRLLDRHPDLQVVLDHGGKPPIARGEWQPWAGLATKAAAHARCACKLSGLLTEAAPGAEVEALRPWVGHLLDTFGPDRLMFGSDWPVLELAAGYADWVGMVEELLAPLPAEAQTAVMGRTAMRVYRLPR